MMVPIFGSAGTAVNTIALVGFDVEAVAMYGLVALLVGLIAWSKFKEPAPSDPYSAKKAGQGLQGGAHVSELGPVVAVPVAGARPTAPATADDGTTPQDR
jgi:hypothetical protein